MDRDIEAHQIGDEAPGFLLVETLVGIEDEGDPGEVLGQGLDLGQVAASVRPHLELEDAKPLGRPVTAQLQGAARAQDGDGDVGLEGILAAAAEDRIQGPARGPGQSIHEGGLQTTACGGLVGGRLTQLPGHLAVAGSGFSQKQGLQTIGGGPALLPGLPGHVGEGRDLPVPDGAVFQTHAHEEVPGHGDPSAGGDKGVFEAEVHRPDVDCGNGQLGLGRITPSGAHGCWFRSNPSRPGSEPPRSAPAPAR